MANPLYERDEGLFITAPQVIAGGFIASLVVLLPIAIGPPLQVSALSAGWAVEVVLAFAAIAVAAMVVAAVGLVAADWWAEFENHKAYAAIGVAVDGLVAPPGVQTSQERNHLYPPAVSNEALWAALTANRHSARSHAQKSAAEIRSTDVEVATWTPVCKNALRPTSASVVDVIPAHERTKTVSGSVVAVATSGRVAAAAKHDAQEALRVRAAIGLTAIWSGSWRCNGIGVNRNVDRTLLVANDGPLFGSRGSDRRLALRTVPIRVISDIIILGQGKRRPPGGEPPPSAPGDNVLGTGVSMRTGIVASTAPDRRHHQRVANKSLQPEVSFEAQRQLMALAEALARQAAREDDAAERLTERSRSPPDTAVETGRDGPDTS